MNIFLIFWTLTNKYEYFEILKIGFKNIQNIEGSVVTKDAQ